MPRTHAEAFSHPDMKFADERTEIRIRTCREPLVYLGKSFHSDVSWDVYRCDECRVEVFAWGGPHWWNYEIPMKAIGA